MIPGKDGSKFNDIALHVKETKARTGTHPPSLSRHGVYKYFSSSEAPFPHLPNGKKLYGLNNVIRLSERLDEKEGR